MTCDEFAMAGLDLKAQTAAAEESAVQLAAREHLRVCAHCAALQATWANLQTDLRALGAETSRSDVPAALESKLLAEFRQHHRNKVHGFPVLVRWALAAAAVLACAVGINQWRIISTAPGPDANRAVNSSQTSSVTPAGPELGESLLASNDENDFTLVPGMIPASLDDAAIVRVEMPRSALGSLGFTVNEEHAADLIQVELLIGDDGQTQAVRLPESTE